MPRPRSKQYQKIGDREIPVEYFRSRVEFNPSSGCEEWQGARNNAGYGMVGFLRSDGQGRMMTAHRMAWMIHTGQAVPEGQQVQHTCHNLLCCTAQHLKLGDHQTKMKDMMAAGRHGFQVNPGWNNINRRNWHLNYDATRIYSPEDIQYCRTHSPEDIAQRFGITLERAQRMRSYMRNGYRWLPYDRKSTELRRGPRPRSEVDSQS